MLDRTTTQQYDSCPRCGAGPEKVLTHKVGGLERGYVRILQCQDCGRSSHQAVPQRDSKD